MKYCDVATLFNGVSVYTSCDIGMLVSETALEELMSRVLGNLIQERAVTKLADDIYHGGDTLVSLIFNWNVP